MPEGFASLVLHIIRNYGGEKGITLTSIYKEIKGAGSWNIGGETWIVPKSFSRSALERSVWGLHEMSHSIERLGKPHEYHYKIASVKEKN